MLASRGGPQQKAEAAVDAARGSGDVRGLIAALGDLKTWTDAVQSLKDTIDQRAEEERQRREQELARMQAHTDALSQNSAELKRRTDLAQATINTSEYQKAQWITDVINGQVGALTRRRGFTPGSGAAWSH